MAVALLAGSKASQRGLCCAVLPADNSNKCVEETDLPQAPQLSAAQPLCAFPSRPLDVPRGERRAQHTVGLRGTASGSSWATVPLPWEFIFCSPWARGFLEQLPAAWGHVAPSCHQGERTGHVYSKG